MEITSLEERAAQSDLWQNPKEAQAIMRQLSEQQELVRFWEDMKRQAQELSELTILACDEDDFSLQQEIEADVRKLDHRLHKAEFSLMFSGEYDSHNALLALHSGAGGTESQDWAEMLLRMYLRWAERSGYQTEVLEVIPGEEAGIKNALVEIKGKFVYGYLRAEHGVHRLVRLSPFDADHARHTSFVLVEILPEVEEDAEIIINPDDLHIETFRSSGPGGQHMQKTSSAVRITHLPTGIVAACQNQRSQLSNKEMAMKVLQARLAELDLRRRAEEKARLKGEHRSAGWGNQIRSYILHPYQMVKDHRTNYTTSNTTAVLDGALEEFMEAFLQSRIGKEREEREN